MLTIVPLRSPSTLRPDPLADFAPVTPPCDLSVPVGVRKDHPPKTCAEFVKWAKRQGAVGACASPAAGAMPHFVGV